MKCFDTPSIQGEVIVLKTKIDRINLVELVKLNVVHVNFSHID